MGVNGKLATLGRALDKIRDMAPTITVDNLRFLIAIAERPGLTVPELAVQLGVSRVGAYERTKRLKTAGLVIDNVVTVAFVVNGCHHFELQGLWVTLDKLIQLRQVCFQFHDFLLFSVDFIVCPAPAPRVPPRR